MIDRRVERIAFDDEEIEFFRTFLPDIFGGLEGRAHELMQQFVRKAVHRCGEYYLNSLQLLCPYFDQFSIHHEERDQFIRHFFSNIASPALQIRYKEHLDDIEMLRESFDLLCFSGDPEVLLKNVPKAHDALTRDCCVKIELVRQASRNRKSILKNTHEIFNFGIRAGILSNMRTLEENLTKVNLPMASSNLKAGLLLSPEEIESVISDFFSRAIEILYALCEMPKEMLLAREGQWEYLLANNPSVR
jgi:hypothetical protein